MQKTNSGISIYQQVIRTTHKYLDPTLSECIDSQLECQLHKTPDQLTKSELSGLIDWIRMIVALVADDNKLIERYISELNQISGYRTIPANETVKIYEHS